MLNKSIGILEYNKMNLIVLKERGLYSKSIKYLPIGFFDNYQRFLLDNDYWDGSFQNKKYDVLFYDWMNDRRQRYITELQKHFNIRVISKKCFGNELYRKLLSSKIVVNIHFYDKALLETTRIYECLSLGVTVVSEATLGMSDYPDLMGRDIEFVAEGDVSGMISTVKKRL